MVTKKIDVTATAGIYSRQTPWVFMLVKNTGSTDCSIDFDREISADSYLLEVGEVITVEDRPFKRLFYKTASSTTTLYTVAG